MLWIWFWSTTIKWILQESGSHECLVSQCIQKLCLHYTIVYLLCNRIMSGKNNVHTLIRNTLLIKTVTITWASASCHLLAGGGPCLHVADWSRWWLLNAGVGATISETKTKWSLLPWWTPPFMNDISIAWDAVYWHLHRTSFKTEVRPLRSFLCFIN